MKQKLLCGCLALAVTVLSGCAQNYYNIPRDAYEKKVRVLGVAPIMVDGSSDIRHPEKDALVNLVKDVNRKNERELVARLKSTGGYFSVGLLDEDADQLFARLFARRERRDDAGVVYNKYFYKAPELKELLAKNTLDAVMFVVVSGLTRPEKVYSSNYLSYLDSEYNYIVMSAQILDADGNILWEYPNFRRRSVGFPPLVSLQYPDFDEAEANSTDLIDVKFKTIAGLTRAFNKTEDSDLVRNLRYSVLYGTIFADMASLQGPERSIFSREKKPEKKETGTEGAPPTTAPEQKPAETPTK
ncbi:MAG TPA: hypothetical protein VIU40_01925 [Geobacteraceae bacterium]